MSLTASRCTLSLNDGEVPRDVPSASLIDADRLQSATIGLPRETSVRCGEPTNRSNRRRRWFSLVLVGVVAATSSCGDAASPSGGDSASASTASTGVPPGDASVDPTIDERFTVAGSRELALRCWGGGSPTVILETGHPNPGGIQDFGGSSFVEGIARRTTVCAYVVREPEQVTLLPTSRGAPIT